MPATLLEVPYVTFPGAGRRGTTVIDRSTAYPLFGWRAGRRAAALVRQGRIDVVHGLGASVLGYAVARRREAGLSAPLVFNPQGLEEFGATDPSKARLKRIAYRPLQAAVRVCARAADAVVATDSSLRPVVLRHLDVEDARVVTIPNAVDVERLTGLASRDDGRQLRREAGVTPDEWVLLSVGRIEQNKGFDVMLRALASLGPDVPPWRWVLVGDGPWRRRIARHVAASGLASRIMMRGREDEPTLHAWYEAADAFVHPTLVRGQLSGHPRGHGPRRPRGGDPRRRNPRQSTARARTAGSSPPVIRTIWPPPCVRRLHRASGWPIWARVRAASSTRSSRGRQWQPRRSPCTSGCGTPPGR